MPSLSHILEGHPRLLVVDAASARIQVGYHPPTGWSWQESQEEAGVGIFTCLESLGVDLSDVEAFAFCDCPGSILGIRTAAMAIRTWLALKPRPVFGYCALALAANALNRSATLIADARKGFWHSYRLGETLQRLPASALSGELLMPEGFRTWDPLPPGTGLVPYRLAELMVNPCVLQAELFTPTGEPDAFLHHEPAYALWEPKIHQSQ